MFTFTMFAAIAAAVIAMYVSYNHYETDLLTSIGLGLAAAVFAGGGLQVGFVPTPEGMGAIAFGAVAGLVVSVAGSRGRASELGERPASSFPLTPHVSGSILDISTPCAVCTNSALTERKAA